MSTATKLVRCHARHWPLPLVDGEPERRERRDCASPVAIGGKHNGGHGRAGAFSNALSTLLCTVCLSLESSDGMLQQIKIICALEEENPLDSG
jgi:hypothetical protein